MRFSSLFSSFAMILLLSGCGSIPLHQGVPQEKINNVTIEGYSSAIRYWGDEAPQNLAAIIERRIALYQTLNSDYYKSYNAYPTMNYLAISGGGNDGAFGAGVLCGWTASGTRPDFAIVTGVSTGALIAPFAFLGKDYDDELRLVYTTIKSENIFLGGVMTVLDGLTGGLALTDNAPLAKKIEETMTPEVFEKIAAEHRKGRRLLIGTTNVEAQRSVIWDIGALANSGNPDALSLFRKIMLASAAIPGAFQPVFIDVTVDGKKYTEIHADGGVTAQVFLYPLQSTRQESHLFENSGIARRLFIIRNTKITPEYKTMSPTLLTLSERSIATLIKYQGLGDLYRLYVGAQRDGIEYNLIQVPSSFNAPSTEIFDPVYMSAIFDDGYNMAKVNIPWQKKPPGVEYID